MRRGTSERPCDVSTDVAVAEQRGRTARPEARRGVVLDHPQRPPLEVSSPSGRSPSPYRLGGNGGGGIYLAPMSVAAATSRPPPPLPRVRAQSGSTSQGLGTWRRLCRRHHPCQSRRDGRSRRRRRGDHRLSGHCVGRLPASLTGHTVLLAWPCVCEGSRNRISPEFCHQKAVLIRRIKAAVGR